MTTQVGIITTQSKRLPDHLGFWKRYIANAHDDIDYIVQVKILHPPLEIGGLVTWVNPTTILVHKVGDYVTFKAHCYFSWQETNGPVPQATSPAQPETIQLHHSAASLEWQDFIKQIHETRFIVPPAPPCECQILMGQHDPTCQYLKWAQQYKPKREPGT